MSSMLNIWVEEGGGTTIQTGSECYQSVSHFQKDLGNILCDGLFSFVKGPFSKVGKTSLSESLKYPSEGYFLCNTALILLLCFPPDENYGK